MSVFKEEQDSCKDLFNIFLVSSEIEETSYCDQQPTICQSSEVANLNNQHYGNQNDNSNPNERPKDVTAYQLKREVLMEETEEVKRETIKEEEDQFIPPNTATETQTDAADQMKSQKTDRLTCALCKKGCTSEDDLSSHLQTHLKANSTPNVKSEDTSTSVRQDKGEESNIQSSPKEKKSSSIVVPSNKRTTTKKKRNVRSVPALPKQCQCTTCGKTLKNEAFLPRHMATHRSKDLWFKCEICAKSFAHKRSYERHTLIHSGIKPYKCKICSQTFRHKPSLKYHHRKEHSQAEHAERFPTTKSTSPISFQCEKCNRKYTSKGNLRDHMRVHNPEDQYNCAYCDQKFTHKTNLKRHIQAMHTDDRPFKCDRCAKPFVEKRRLKAHLKSCVSSQSLDDDDDPSRHTVTEETYKSFTDEKNSLKCAKCAKVFPCQAKLRYHIRKYLNVKPYQCEECREKIYQVICTEKTHQECTHQQ